MEQSHKEYPYEVYHAEALGPTPKFKTWEEARSMQVEWNKDVPGHRARKRTEDFEEAL